MNFYGSNKFIKLYKLSEMLKILNNDKLYNIHQFKFLLTLIKFIL
jgi:hypothetical protein